MRRHRAAWTPRRACHRSNCAGAVIHVVRPLLGVGALYKLSDHVDLRADYDHVSGLGKSNKTGKMDANLFSLGLAYNF